MTTINDKENKIKLSEEKMDIASEAIGMIRREIGYSYPYKSGSVTINCAGYDKTTLLYILNWFMIRESHIEVNYEKNQAKITGYMSAY